MHHIIILSDGLICQCRDAAQHLHSVVCACSYISVHSTYVIVYTLVHVYTLYNMYTWTSSRPHCMPRCTKWKFLTSQHLWEFKSTPSHIMIKSASSTCALELINKVQWMLEQTMQGWSLLTLVKPLQPVNCGLAHVP